MYQPRDLERICKNIADNVGDEFSKIGIFFRIFHRVKINSSIQSKIQKKGEHYYDKKNKFISDIIGIRIILYFSDDLDIVYNWLKNFFKLVEETVDKNEETRFAPTRINLVLKLPDNFTKEFKNVVKDD